MGRARTRLAQIEEMSGLTPAAVIGGSVAAAVATSVGTAVWGATALAVALAGLAFAVALVARANLARLHREHRALLEVVTDLTALVGPSADNAAPRSKAQRGGTETLASPAAAADEAHARKTLNDSDQPPVVPEPDEIVSSPTAEPGEQSKSLSVVADTESVSDPTEAASAEAASSQDAALRVAASWSAREQTLSAGYLSSQDDDVLPRLADMLPPSPLDMMLRIDLGLSETESTPIANAASPTPAETITTQHHDQPAGTIQGEESTIPAVHSEPTDAAAADCEANDPTEAGSGAMQDDTGDAASQMWKRESGAGDEDNAAEATALPAPSFTLPRLDGQIADQTAFKGRPTIFVFWRPDCPYSQAITPELVALQSEIGEEGPRLVIVASSDAETAEWQGFDPTTLLDPTFSLGQSLGVAGTPAAVLLGPEGEPFGQIGLGATAVLGMIRASCRAWATLTGERQSSASSGANDNPADSPADTKTRLELGPNPFERLAAEITPLHPVIVRRPSSRAGLLDELDAEWDKEHAFQRRAG